jgi:ubiquinone/menaquinone biosynthesis C-methylase UbiE
MDEHETTNGSGRTGRHVAKNTPAKTAGQASKKSAAKKTPAQKTPAKKAIAKQTVAKKAPAKKAVAKKAVAKKAEPEQNPPPTETAPAAEAGPAEGPQDGAPLERPPAVPDLPAAQPASAEDVERAWKDNCLAQVLYHDWEARNYDDKWSISFDERCITYARDRFSAVVGPEVLRDEPWPYAKSLEIGAGTGFFSLNLKQAGVLDQVHVSDVSAGMVENAKLNAQKLGFEVTGTISGAESLPYDDNTFDIVVGHAVLHHIPDVELALREVIRVLKPGGRFVIAGEPTRIGDWYARRLGRITWRLTTRVTHLKPFRERWAKSKEELHESSHAAALEAVVDLHTFVPAELSEMARRAGATNVHTQTEELLAAFLGWPVRTFEAAVNPQRLGRRWSSFAYRSWLRLSAADRLLSKAIPQRFFYNVGVTGTKGA